MQTSTEVKIGLPKLGESILSATVTRWFKQEGDFIKEDEPLLEVTTDKVNSEIPSTHSGILKKIVALCDQEVQVGEALAIVEITEAFESEPKKSVFFVSPAVKSLAAEQKITLEELKNRQGSGCGGRVTKKDLEKEKLSSIEPSFSKEEKIKLSPLRKSIAETMCKSFYTAPHATLITEIDVTDLLSLIENQKKAFIEKNGFKLTVTSFFAEAISKTVKKFKFLNASYDEESILVKQEVNLGIAVSVEGGVIVPVIHQSHLLCVTQIAKKIAEFADKAKKGILEISQTQQGSITLSNFGISGALIGVPIIRYPEVAILALGSVTKTVAVIKDMIAVRSKVYLTLTFDHRVVDGIYASEFLKEMKSYLENRHQNCDL